MDTSYLFGSLLATSEDFAPIVRQIRSKYGIPELIPGDDPITEIYLDDKPISLEDFRQEIFGLVRAAPDFLPPKTAQE